jgi:NAD(P)-dependent dehydrogenase (short-subunit alcohol dehydrogenase family)
MARRRSWTETRSLVTGASSGLGKAIAQHLVRAGASVVLTGRSADRLTEAAERLIREGADSRRILTVPADLTVEDDRRRLFELIKERHDALDVVINADFRGGVTCLIDTQLCGCTLLCK